MKKIALPFLIVMAFSLAPVKLSLAANIKINEFLATSTTSEKEWIEIYSDNQTDFHNYYFKNKTGIKKTIDSTENCGNYYVWELSTSSGEVYLNNTVPESIFLYDTGDNLIDSYENWTAPSHDGKTLSRIPDSSGNFSETESSKCAKNQALSPTPSLFASPTPSPSPAASSPTPTPETRLKSSPKIPPSSSPKTSLSGQGNDVLGETTSSALVQNPEFNQSPPPQDSYQSPVSPKAAAIFIVSGAVLIGIAFFIFIWYKKSQESLKINKENDRFEDNTIEE